MSTQFETLNQQRNRYRAGYLVSLGIFLVAWFARAALRISGSGQPNLEHGLLAVLVLCVLVQAFFVIREILVKQAIKRDPVLRERLEDELVRLNELKAWRTAFLVLAGYLALVLVLLLFVRIGDLGLVVVTGLLIGLGSYYAASYWLNR